MGTWSHTSEMPAPHTIARSGEQVDSVDELIEQCDGNGSVLTIQLATLRAARNFLQR
jgi:hypothetical protein